MLNPVKSTEACRLCGGATAFKFQTQLIGKHDVDYFVCTVCASLETQAPFWLDEAYASNLGDLDCGAAQRNLSNLAACLIVARLWGVRNAIDHGGGDGLLCRLLRDYGVNCFVEDKYASHTYALAFTKPDFQQPDAVFAFEVLEHFTDPAAEIAALLNRKPAIFFGTTERYRGQGEDWWYLSKRSGHHIFFYSDNAMQIIARQHGYRLIQKDAYFVFVRPDKWSGLRATLFKLLTKGVLLRLIRSLAVALPARGPAKDIALLQRVEKLGRQSS